MPDGDRPLSVPDPVLDPLLQRRARKLSLVEGLLHAVMVGASESYLGALAVELGHSDTNLALLATVPLLVAACGQLFCEPLTRLFGGRRRFVVAGAVVQALAHLYLIAIALDDERRLWPLLLAKCLFWLSGTAIAPAWAAWMGRLTEDTSRPRYFALRSSAASLALLVSFTIAGALLAHSGAARLEIYALLFSVALGARLLSALALRLKRDPDEDLPRPLPTPVYRELWRALTTSRWRVAVYMAALLLCSNLCVPFFTPYMLRELRLDYLSFAGLTSASILGKALLFPLLHRVSLVTGHRGLLAAGGLGIAVVPVLWTLVDGFGELVLVQGLSGAAWGAVEFASFQVLLTSASPSLLGPFVALSSCLSSAAQVAGALCGGLLLSALKLRYVDAFLLSGAARMLPLGLLLGDVSVRAARGAVAQVISRLESVRPTGGGVRRFAPLPPRRWPSGRGQGG